MNRALKHKNLKMNTGRSVTDFMIVFKTNFHRYIKRNCKLTEANKLCNTTLLAFLYNRTSYFIKCMYSEYISTVKMCNKEGNSKVVGQNTYLVENENDEKSKLLILENRFVIVSTLTNTTLYRFFQLNFNHSFNDLPKEYLQNLFFILDEKASDCA